MASILVVCTGNICRSPIAEELLRRELVRRFGAAAPDVSSAGTIAWDGNPATPETVIAARERGVEIQGHRARGLTRAMVDEADLVLCMAAEHRRSVIDASPAAADRTFALKELVRLLDQIPVDGTGLPDELGERVKGAAEVRADGFAGNPYDEGIADPLGQPMAAYRGVAWELDELIGRLDVGLFGAREESIRP